MSVFFVRSQITWRLLAALTFLMLGTSIGRAQVTETPVSFDSAGHVRSISPSLASRFRLVEPFWPVAGEFDEARLFAVSSGGYVITVLRRGGRIDRYSIDETQRARLRAEVDDAMTHVGKLVGEEGPAVMSEPARTPFIRNQMILSALLYGPAAATLTHDASGGAAVYLLTTGASFFYLADLAKRVTVTRAQNHLATDGAIRGALMVGGTLNALGIETNADWGAASTLIGGLGGSVVGYMWGKRLTDSEAHSATVGSTLLAGAVTGAIGTFGGYQHDPNGRTVSAALVGGAIVGYPLGLSYPRRASYTVTAGDARLLPLGALLAIGIAGTPIVDTGIDDKAAAGILTLGLVTGTIAADRWLVRPFDHTESDATLVWLGALAGGLMGAAFPVLTESDDAHFAVGSVTLGAILGTIAADHLVEPRKAGGLATRVGKVGATIHVDPLGMVGAVTRRPGVYPLLSLQF